MTKKQLFAISTIILMVFVSISCETIKDEINEAAAFDVNTNLDDQYFSIDSLDFLTGKSVKGWQTLYQFDDYINVDSIFAANNLSSASIENGVFTSVQLDFQNLVPGLNFDFAQEMQLSIATSAGGTATVVASTGIIPANSTNLVFTVNSTDIASFINNDHFYITLEADMIDSLPFLHLLMQLNSGVQFTVTPL